MSIYEYIYEYEMLLERGNLLIIHRVKNLLRISLISFPPQQNEITVKLWMRCIQLGTTFLPENWIYRSTVLEQKPLDFTNVLHKFFHSKRIENHHYQALATIHNNFRHCRVSFSPFVRQPFSKQLYMGAKRDHSR